MHFGPVQATGGMPSAVAILELEDPGDGGREASALEGFVEGKVAVPPLAAAGGWAES